MRTKRTFIVIAFLLVIGLGLGIFFFERYAESPPPALPALTQAEVNKAMGVSETEPTTSSVPVNTPFADLDHPLRLAIGSLGLSSETENSKLADLLTVELTGARGIALVERQAINRALQELELSLSSALHAKEAVRLGKILPVDWFLLATTARSDGTNVMVVRVVDAHTGVMQDIGVVPAAENDPGLAKGLAEFVRQSRLHISAVKPRIYLALGGFADLSQNDNLTGLSTALRNHLTASYRNSRITILEREVLQEMLQEARLDLAGLTDTDNEHPVAMQYAFWLVDGMYQSYGTSGKEIELSMTVTQIRKAPQSITLRETSQEALFIKAKDAIDTAMNQPGTPQGSGRRWEVRQQLSLGLQLAGVRKKFNRFLPSYREMTRQEALLEQHNMEEAIRAFTAVLLLEPTDREAKIGLSFCLGNQTIGRIDEARQYYQEILEEGKKDQWDTLARNALFFSFDWSSAQEKAAWYAQAARQTHRTNLATFYGGEAAKVANDIAFRSSQGDERQQLGEKRMFQSVQAWANEVKSHIYRSEFERAFGDIFGSFGTNKIALAQRLAELLPELQKQQTNLAPHLLIGVLIYQVDTNTPVLEQFKKSFKSICQNTNSVYETDFYFMLVRRVALTWALQYKLFDLARDMDANAHPSRFFSDDPDTDKLKLAFGYFNGERWQEALNIFQCYSNLPVSLSEEGSWGSAFRPVLTSYYTALCRQKLGLPEIQDPRQFHFGKACLPFHHPASFALDADGVWFALLDKLVHLDFNLKTNCVIALPKAPDFPVSSMCLSSSNIWIGTAGAGLINYNLTTRKCRQMTAKNDGLMQDSILSLYADASQLWIGYAGGLGKLDFATGEVRGFTPSLLARTPGSESSVDAAKGSPVTGPVKAICGGPGADLWFSQQLLRRHNSGDDSWEEFNDVEADSITTDGVELFMAGKRLLFGKHSLPPSLGVFALNLKDHQWRSIPPTEGLPANQAKLLVLDGRMLWVAGFGYIAQVDLQRNIVSKFAYFKSDRFDKIAIGGGYIWAQLEGHLYRAPLQN